MIVSNFQRDSFGCLLDEVPAKDLPAVSDLSYRIQAGGQIPANFTGLLNGRIPFVNGEGRVERYFDVRMARIKGCQDVTPESIRERLDARELKKILIIRNAAFGDCLMITPALKALREKYPSATIHVFGKAGSRVVYENLPFIDGVLTCRDVEVGAIVDEYDEVYDLVHTIEHCPEADWESTLDVACQYLGVESPKSPPIYNVSQEELQRGAQLLVELGINPRANNLILFQCEATAHARTLPPKPSLEVAYKLAEAGYQVLFVGNKPEIPLMRAVACEGCGGQEALFVPPEAVSLAGPCEACEKETEKQVLPLHPGIRFLHEVAQKYEAREQFAICHFARMVIATDSFWSHLAAALDKPAVYVFSNYYPYLRIKYYHRSVVVAPDRKKLPCFPCNDLVAKCHMYGNQPAGCIASITSGEILEKAFAVLDGKIELYQAERDEPIATPGEVPDCPGCGHKESVAHSSKGRHFYRRCLGCQSLFTERCLTSQEKMEARAAAKDNRHYRPSRNLSLKDYLPVIETMLRRTQGAGPSRGGVADLVGLADVYCGRKPWSEIVPGIKERSESGKSQIQEELVFWVDGLLEADDPGARLEGVIGRMEDKSYLAFILPLSNL